ncbi:MAG: DUF885 domain-containing protein [Oscillospiraceae bacterium]|nr:DUF885 domain-containing protein [Oscillospiraceae bacterium]
MKKLLSILLSIILIVAFAACKPPEIIIDDDERGSEKRRTAGEIFDEFLEKEFIEHVTSDTISLHFSVRYPETFGIKPFEATFGEFGINSFYKYEKEIKAAHKLLKSLDYSKLNQEQQLIYDIFMYSIEFDLEHMSEELYYYNNVLNPSTGIHVQMPVLLAEYRFYSEKDIKDYLSLLTKLDEYYEAVLIFQQEKSERGLFMADFTAQEVIEACYEFVETGENNFLIDTFDSRIDQLDIPDEEKTAYKEENKNNVLNHVIPAYINLAEGITALKGTGTNPNGLAHYEKGKEFYEYRITSTTGSSKSIDEMIKLIDKELDLLLDEMIGIISLDRSLLDYLDDVDYGYYDPIEIIEVQKEKMLEYFPEGANVDYVLNYVHPSLEESLSPAFYLMPPVDDVSSNVMYININQLGGHSVFTILAHEGYPGHLYQNTYFNDKDINPIRKVFYYPGYTEGWATYAEYFALQFANYPAKGEMIAKILDLNAQWGRAFQSRIDIGVNYEGWTLNELSRFMKDYGYDSPEMAKDLFEYAIGSPGDIIKYYIGYVEIIELRDYTMDALGEDFSYIEFHRCVLDTGPVPFFILKQELDKYISTVS